MSSYSISKQLQQHLIAVHGPKANEWVLQLPHRLKTLSQQLGITDLSLMENLSYNIVYRANMEHTPVILKMGPDQKEIAQEAKALKSFQTHGIVPLLEGGEDFLLLEQVIPGTSLKSTFPEHDSCALDIVHEVITELHKASPPPEGHFSSLEHWFKIIQNPWDVPDPYLLLARQLADNLLKTTERHVLLHGDLHHNNILSTQTGWIAIDPKGVIGDPLFDYCAFMRNPHPDLLNHLNTYDIIKTRLNCLAAKPNIDRQRLLNWCFVDSVLSWVWRLEDGLETPTNLKLTDLYFHMRKKYA